MSCRFAPSVPGLPAGLLSEIRLCSASTPSRIGIPLDCASRNFLDCSTGPASCGLFRQCCNLGPRTRRKLVLELTAQRVVPPKNLMSCSTCSRDISQCVPVMTKLLEFRQPARPHTPECAPGSALPPSPSSRVPLRGAESRCPGAGHGPALLPGRGEVPPAPRPISGLAAPRRAASPPPAAEGNTAHSKNVHCLPCGCAQRKKCRPGFCLLFATIFTAGFPHLQCGTSAAGAGAISSPREDGRPSVLPAADPSVAPPAAPGGPCPSGGGNSPALEPSLCPLAL
mmetsp:Transcript_18852/g.59152  ORF Transcript_18852/g.59152 Transcript_18852/m.59152 type:complete len:283 (+) Transcript_18852:222-1070(+)